MKNSKIIKRVVFIVAGGELDDPAFFRKQFKEVVPASLICADSGANHLMAAGLAPDVLVGDLDSIDRKALRDLEKAGCRIVRHPRQKDETDAELAVYEALALHPAEIWIWGAMGKRLDHTLANLSLLSIGIQKGAFVKLIDPWCEVFMINRPFEITGKKGQTVSLFPVGQKAQGVSLKGFEYPLSDALMEIGHPYGVSNRLAGRKGIIEVASGILLVIRYFRPGVFPTGEGR